MNELIRRVFIVLTVVWLTSLTCLTVGFPQPAFVIFVSYSLNALACLAIVWAAGNTEIVRDGEGE